MNEEQKEETVLKKNLGKKEIIIIAAIAVAILAVILFFILSRSDNNDTDNNNTTGGENNIVDVEKPNENPGVIEDQEQDGLKFTNTALITSKYNSTLTTLVTNTTDSDIEVRIFDIFVKDADGNIIATLQGYVGGVVPANGSREIESSVDMDLSTAADIEYKLVK